MKRLLSQFFNIRPNEWRRVAILYLMGFLFIAGSTWGETVVESLFLHHIGVEYLPYVFMGDALVSMAAVAVYTAFVDRMPNRTLVMAITLVGSAAIILALLFLSQGVDVVAYPLLYLLFRVVRDTFNLHWWTYVGDFYDTRAAKRVIPLLSSAARVAGIVAGLSMRPLLALLTPTWVIALWVATLGVIALLAHLMPRLVREVDQQEQGARAAGPASAGAYVRNLREGYQYVLGSPFLRWMALSTLLLFTLFGLLNYQTSQIFLARLSSVEEMASFVGALNGVSNLIMLPVQLFLLSRIVGRMGLGNANLVYPALTLAIAGALVGLPAHLATASLAYFDRTTFRTTFRNTLDNLLFNAVPLRTKGRARAFIGGLVVPIGSLLGGGLLLALPVASVTWIVPVLIVAFALAYLLSAVLIRNHYAQALLAMLEQEDFSSLLSATSGEAIVADAATLGRLRSRLDEATSDDFKLFMAHLIGELGGADAVPILADVAASSNAHVRAGILDILVVAETRGESVRQLYSEALADPDGRVRLAAFTGLQQLAGAQPSEQFLSLALDLLRDPVIDVQAQALSTLVRSGDFFYMATASQALSQLLVDADPQRRARGVRALGQTGDVRFVRSLVDYLTDAADEVRLEAALAVEQLSETQLGEQAAALFRQHVDRLLQDPIERVRRATLTILSRMPGRDLHLPMVRALADPSPQVREAAAASLVSLGRPVMGQLSAMLGGRDRRLDTMLAIVLCRIDREQHDDLVRTHVDANLHLVYTNLGRLHALDHYRGPASVALLQVVIQEQSRRLTAEIFTLLAGLFPQNDLTIVAEALQGESPRARANAAEALESLTTPQLAQLIAPLFDPDVAPAQLLAISTATWDTPPHDPLSVVRQIMADYQDPWLQALMTFALGDIGATLAAPVGAVEVAQPAPPAGRGRRAVGRLLDALVEPEEPASGDDQAGRRGRRRVGRLLDALAEPDGASPPVELPRLTLAEVQTLVGAAATHPDLDVRAAAQAATRILAGEQAGALAHKEEPMLSIIEKIIFLKEVPFFREMTVDQLKVLANVCEEQLFPEDTRIFAQGDPGGALYVVVHGRVGIERDGERPNSTVRLATIEAHASFGEMSLFDNSPRDSSALALQDTLTLRLRREPLIALARQYPDMSLELINVLSQRLRDANDQIARLTRARPREMQKIYDRLD